MPAVLPLPRDQPRRNLSGRLKPRLRWTEILTSVAGSFHSSHNPGKANGRSSFIPYREWNLGAANRAPFVKAISQNKAPTFFERFAVRRRGVDRFSSGIDCLVGDLRIFCPVRDQSPAGLRSSWEKRLSDVAPRALGALSSSSKRTRFA